MRDLIVPERFVEGRDTYVARIPLLNVVERLEAIEAEAQSVGSHQRHPDCHTLSFVLGFFDGMLADIRDAADNARDELAARK
jgi:hypothetical protein